MLTAFDFKCCDSPRIIPPPSDWDYIVPEIHRPIGATTTFRKLDITGK